jgi:uncharacterized protein involved in exopolysaccharide biosynthesis
MKKGSTGVFSVKSLSLRDAAVVVFRHKWLILLTFLTTAAAASLFAVFMPDKFESRMKILVKHNRVDAPVTSEKVDVASDRNEVSESQIVSEIELLKSRDLLEQVVRNTNIAENPNGGVPTDQDIERAVYQLEKDLIISPVKKANIIEVDYTSKSPEVAANVLNQLSELYLDKHIKLHRPPGTFEFFKTQAEQYEKDLRSAENNLTSYQKKIGVVSITQEKDLGIGKFMETQARLNDLDGQIKETGKRIAEIEKQLSGTQSRISTQSRVIPNQDSVERFNTMLVELRNRRIQLLTKFQPTDRLVKEFDEQIRTTTDALAKASQTTYSEQASDLNPLRQTLENELNKAKIEQAGRLPLRENLAAQVAQYKQQLDKLKGATTTHDDLSRQVKKADESYQLYAQKQEESRISDELDKQKISNVSIAEAPTVPRVPYKTNRTLTVVLGLGMGLLLGFGCAITAEFFRETIHTPRELEALTGISVLATVPLNSRRPRELNVRFRTSEPTPEPEDSLDSEEDFFIEFMNSKNHAVHAKH